MVLSLFYNIHTIKEIWRQLKFISEASKRNEYQFVGNVRLDETH